MADDDAGFRNQFLQLGGDFPDAVDAVVDEVDLAAAFEFLFDRRLDEFVVPAGDDGLNRHAVFGRSFDDAHIAQADQRHVQRARNRRGRHGEHVDLLAHLLDALFVADAEALFFVDDQQAEVGELEIFRQDAVRADEDVDFAGFGFLQNFFLLFRVAEAADHFDGDGERSEALLESFVVLEGEDGGGSEHGDLLVVADGLECCAHGDFCLAIADVAAQQAVHGLSGFHVAGDVVDGLGLIFGFVELESVFELTDEFVAGGESVSLGHFAFGVELEKFVGHVFHGLADAGFGFGPGLRAEVA